MNTLDQAKSFSSKKIEQLRNNMQHGCEDNNICVYACGSLGRYEATEKSDLDLFFILMNDERDEERIINNISKYVFFGKLYEINKEMGFKEPSKGGLYWEFISEKKLLDIGSQEEDYNNSFTARMLMILESKPLFNDQKYIELRKRIIEKYFEDYQDHNKPFYPLYLMNDILRYWYTLTLNYEYRRDANDDTNKKYWRRLKLKYARLFTCFSMLMCLFKKDINVDDVVFFSSITPFERIEYLSNIYDEVRDGHFYDSLSRQYEWFLDLRNETSDWWDIDSNKTIAIEKADRFHLTIKNMFAEIAKYNPQLADRMDIIIG